MNNPSFDRLMLEAAAAAYNVKIVNQATGAATLTGADPNGVVYAVSPTGVIQNTGLGVWGYTIERGFDDTATGFKGMALSRTKADGTKDWIFSFTGTEPTVLDVTSDLQLGWNQWKSSKGGQAAL